MADLPTDWSSPVGAPRATSKQKQLLDDFIDDFEDDDDAFFNATSQPQYEGERKESEGANNMDTFGMLPMNYAIHRSASVNNTVSGDRDSVELQEIEPHLAHLRNVGSSYRNVATSCLVINQSLHNSGSSSQNAQSIIVHNQHFERYMQRIIEALSACLEHNSSAARILAAKTMGMLLRSSLAKCEFDPRLISELIEDRIQDNCLGAAYALVNTALEGDDAVSSAALESLGLFTLDAQADSLAAEVYAIAENGDPNSLIYKSNDLPPSNTIMKEIQIKVYNNILFPRMSKLLQRLSLFAPNHLVKVMPVITAAFESALTEGSETIPARRAVRTTKLTHGKRGWFETDAVTLVREYVEILLGSFEFKQGKKGAAVACIRLSNISPLASWREEVSRSAVAALIEILNEDTALVSSEKNVEETVDSTLSLAITPSESIGGVVGLLLVALRGVPLSERAAGLVSALRAVMLFLPMGMVIPRENQRLDLPLTSMKDDVNSYRLGRVGLIAEIALLVMVDGDSNIENLKTHQSMELPASADDKTSKEKITGERAMLLNHILQSHHLSSIWDTQQKKNNRLFRPVDELVWVFCSTLLQLGRHNEHVFSKDFSYLIEWSNLVLVVLDNFGKFVCRPMTLSPFSHAAHASYTDLMSCLMKKSGLVIPSTLSIRDNMLPSALLADNDANLVSTASVVSSRFNLSVVGGPGRQMPHIASALSKVCQNMLVLWSKARTAYPGPGDQPNGNILMGAVLVDAWLGRCIINHDTKQSNQGQLEAASSLLALIQAEMNLVLESNGTLPSFVKDDPSSYFNATVHLLRVCMASLEALSKMSVILWNIESETTNDDEVSEDKTGPLAVSILHAFMEASKEALDANANAGRDVMILSLYQQASIDANDTIARIVDFSPANVKQQSHHDDIATQLQPSPFLSSKEGLKGKVSLERMLRMSSTSYAPSKQEKKASFNDLSFIKELPSSLLSQLHPMHQNAFFLYHHARLVVPRLVVCSLKAVALAFPSTTAGPPRDVHQMNPHRLPNSLHHCTIEMYHRPRDLPVLVPAPSTKGSLNSTELIGTEPIVLTGCSDPVSLTMSYELRRVRRGDLSEEGVLVVTTRLYNITPVSIRNGVKLNLRASHNHDSSWNGAVTSMYSNEIKGGDFITWETCFGRFKAGNISLQASIMFRDMVQECTTRKLVSLDDDVGANDIIRDEEDEVTKDITITCRPVTLPALAMLQPCPLVFFGCKHRRASNDLGDEIAFRFFWSNSKHECSKSHIYQGSNRLAFDDKLGRVTLEAQGSSTASSGSAFITPDGVRVLCMLEDKGNGSYLLRLRSDSAELLQSLVGADNIQSVWLAFLFGSTAVSLDDTPPGVARPKLEHDFASVTMPHHQLEHDFASMTMPHHQLDVSQ